MPPRRETDVVIAGGGPVGTTLALDLASKGIRTIVVEQRLDMPPNPKCNTTNARSMEHFRRLGCADAIRRVGLPLDRPTDVVYATRWTGHELTRYRLRSSADVLARATSTDAIDAYWNTPEPQHRVSQLAMEPVLREHTKTFSACDYREGWRFTGYAEQTDHVTCTIERIADGTAEQIDCAFLVSCEGARSTVRSAMGTQLTGREVVTKFCTTYLRCPDLDPRWPHEPGWMHRIYNADGESHIIAIDGRELWLHHSVLGPDADVDAHDHRPAIRHALGFDARYDVLGQERWTARAMVADHYRRNRVFLCGDAAHIWIPMGGFGMNAGVEDAVNLAWKLWAVLDGWASADLLDSYEAERRPVGQLVAGSAAKIFESLYEIPVNEPAFESDGPDGEALRRAIGEAITAHNVSEFDSIGMQLGVAYDASPVICYDGAQSPPFAIDRYSESSRPGVRAPHFWRHGGNAAYDDFGPGFTLLALGDAATSTAPFESACAKRGVPLHVMHANEAEALERYERFPFVLVRPDQHIAWRGTALPESPGDVIDTITAA